MSVECLHKQYCYLSEDSEHDDDGSVGDPHVQHLTIHHPASVPSTTLTLTMTVGHMVRQVAGKVQVMIGV